MSDNPSQQRPSQGPGQPGLVSFLGARLIHALRRLTESALDRENLERFIEHRQAAETDDSGADLHERDSTSIHD